MVLVEHGCDRAIYCWGVCNVDDLSCDDTDLF